LKNIIKKHTLSSLCIFSRKLAYLCVFVRILFAVLYMLFSRYRSFASADRESDIDRCMLSRVSCDIFMD